MSGLSFSVLRSEVDYIDDVYCAIVLCMIYVME